ncbi:MAG TPA: hypothetical protein VNA12_01085 [Mycobacteriales bacterium]|nr:hypothetical protein [Mycobacteriales bacterium]
MILRRRSRAAVPSSTAVSNPRGRGPAVEHYEGVTILPEEGAKLRVDSAADIDPNVKARGLEGIPRGDAGGFGGAGTK